MAVYPDPALGEEVNSIDEITNAHVAKISQLLWWRGIFRDAIHKAWSDDAFRAELKQDAKAAIHKHLKYTFAEGEIDIRCVDAPAAQYVHEILGDPNSPKVWKNLNQVTVEIPLPVAPELDCDEIDAKATPEEIDAKTTKLRDEAADKFEETLSKRMGILGVGGGC